jgi:hypothetical protein
MHEDVLASIVGRYETIALGGVEEFHCAVLAHPMVPFQFVAVVERRYGRAEQASNQMSTMDAKERGHLDRKKRQPSFENVCQCTAAFPLMCPFASVHRIQIACLPQFMEREPIEGNGSSRM